MDPPAELECALTKQRVIHHIRTIHDAQHWRQSQRATERTHHSMAVRSYAYAKFLEDGDDAANAKISARRGQGG